jgi:uncharacterized protein
MRVRIDVARAHDEAADPDDLRAAIADRLGVALSAIGEVTVVKRALDARRKLPRPTWHLTVEAEVDGRVNKKALLPIPDPVARLQSPRAGPEPIAVVGAGPAGLFAAWHLAEHGARVILIERGKPVETRARDFGRFRGRGLLDTESNICFGEGGAGTYSDGKLTTRKNDPLVREVLERLVEVGAPDRILVDAKPHIGTNKLFGMLKGLRARLIELGVEIRFETRVERLQLTEGALTGLETNKGTIGATAAILATGHSARDTFEALLAQGVPMEVKPFAVGVRAEHRQELIDSAQYRLKQRPATLPPADYRLTHDEHGRGVYSFCMCPGGMVIPASTEPNMVVVNGMSTARRSSPFANSGVVVQVALQDLEREGFGSGPLAGIEFQRALERKAFEVGGGNYFAPAMLARDLVAKKASGKLADSHFRPGLTPADLREALPAFIAHDLAAALARFDRILKGYASSEANLIAVESRTSSPLRIPRDPETMQVIGFPGLYVAGEGPGYAGGIMSAAVDGLRVAHALLSRK